MTAKMFDQILDWINQKAMEAEIREYGCLDPHWQPETWGTILGPVAGIIVFYFILFCVGSTAYRLIW